MEIQRIMNKENNLEKEEQNWRAYTARLEDLTSKAQKSSLCSNGIRTNG
jgi:hypothetical protein